MFFPFLRSWGKFTEFYRQKYNRGSKWSKVKWKVKWGQQIRKSHASADILPHVNIVLSRSPRLSQLPCASAHSSSMLSPLYHTAWFTPPEKQWKFPSEPLRVTPSVCACLSANASSFLKLGPPVGLQTLLTAHSYASLLPNSTSTGMRKKPKVFLDYIFGAWRYQRMLVMVVFGKKLLDWFWGLWRPEWNGKKGEASVWGSAPCLCVGWERLRVLLHIRDSQI